MKKEKIVCRSASCLGVKVCPTEACTYIAPIRERRASPEVKLYTEGCLVELVYNNYCFQKRITGTGLGY